MIHTKALKEEILRYASVKNDWDPFISLFQAPKNHFYVRFLGYFFYFDPHISAAAKANPVACPALTHHLHLILPVSSISSSGLTMFPGSGSPPTQAVRSISWKGRITLTLIAQNKPEIRSLSLSMGQDIRPLLWDSVFGLSHLLQTCHTGKTQPAEMSLRCAVGCQGTMKESENHLRSEKDKWRGWADSGAQGREGRRRGWWCTPSTHQVLVPSSQELQGRILRQEGSAGCGDHWAEINQ